MLNKEKTYLRDTHFLQRHPLLQPKMRAILLDWLMEVSWSPWQWAAQPSPEPLPCSGLRGPGPVGTCRVSGAAITLPRSPFLLVCLRASVEGFLKSPYPLDIFKLASVFFLDSFAAFLQWNQGGNGGRLGSGRGQAGMGSQRSREACSLED